MGPGVWVFAGMVKTLFVGALRAEEGRWMAEGVRKSVSSEGLEGVWRAEGGLFTEGTWSLDPEGLCN